jgi:hypothetical protein
MIKLFTTALLGSALLVSSAGVAGAGGGGFGSGPFGDVFLTDCYRVGEGDKNDDDNGNKHPFTMDVTDQFGRRQNLRVGDAQFVCVLSGPWQRQAGSNSPPLNLTFDPTTANAAKCYEVSSPGDRGPGAVGTVTDIFSSEKTVLRRMNVLCSPATLSTP